MDGATPRPDIALPGVAPLILPLRFSYHQAVAPLLWALVAVGVVELAVTHLLVALWNPLVAVLVSLLTLGGLLWLIRGMLTMKRRPVLLDRERLVMQVGTIRRVVIPLRDVAGLRPSIDLIAMRRRSVLNLALLAYPNLIVDLVAPLPGRRGITTIAHRLDDPAAFAAAWKALGAGG
jgi:hypothetical protein